MAVYKVCGIGEDGKYTDNNARSSVINYCLHDSKAIHYIGSRAVNIAHAAEEMEVVAKVYHNNDRVRIRHSIISFDDNDNITPEQAAAIAEAAISFYGNQYQIVYGVHEDADHLHIHMAMNQVSYMDGRKFRGTKADHYAFIHYMQQVVRPYGISIIPVSDQPAFMR